MDKNKIIDKYKKLKKTKTIAKLHDGSEVIGSEVDENNFLYYVFKRGNKYEVEQAQKLNIIETYPIINIRQYTDKN